MEISATTTTKSTFIYSEKLVTRQIKLSNMKQTRITKFYLPNESSNEGQLNESKCEKRKNDTEDDSCK